MYHKKKNTSRHNSLLARLLMAFAKNPKTKPTPTDLEKIEFKTSTQKIGLSFTEKIRNTFRHRWLKKSSPDSEQ